MGGLPKRAASKMFGGGGSLQRQGTKMFEGGSLKREGTKMFAGGGVKREGTKMFGGPGFSNSLTQRLMQASRSGDSQDGDESLSLGTMSMLELEAAQEQSVKILLEKKMSEYRRSV